jgi:hypothetical protein
VIPFRELSSPFRRYSRLFAMITAYLDESYNGATFCVGGWVMYETHWPRLERDWRQWIDRERQRSVKAGSKPISRYHASDCSNLQGEYSSENGWGISRQHKFAKRLLGIIIKHKPQGVVIGGSVDLFKKHFPEDSERWRRAMYYYSIALVMNEINEIRKAHYPCEKITIFYDRGKLSSMADVAFRSLKEDASQETEDVASHFVAMTSLGWEDTVLLQPADLIAYEGMKRMDGHLKGKSAIRKSFAALLDKRVDIGVSAFTDAYFTELKKAKLRFIEEAEIDAKKRRTHYL